jgi:diacylglycerol O-acyltransferase / trehalose O-mycolyltransferase
MQRLAETKDVTLKMKRGNKFQRRWSVRVAVAVIAAALPGLVGVVGDSAKAAAFSHPGLPVQCLDAPLLGRNIGMP